MIEANITVPAGDDCFAADLSVPGHHGFPLHLWHFKYRSLATAGCGSFLAALPSTHHVVFGFVCRSAALGLALGVISWKFGLLPIGNAADCAPAALQLAEPAAEKAL